MQKPKNKPNQKSQALDPSLETLLKSEAFRKVIDWVDLVRNPAKIILPAGSTSEQRVHQQIKTEVFQDIINTLRTLNVTAKQQSIESTYQTK